MLGSNASGHGPSFGINFVEDSRSAIAGNGSPPTEMEKALKRTGPNPVISRVTSLRRF